MSGPGVLAVAASASVTAPSALPITVGSAAAAQYRTYGAYDTVYLPSIGAMLHLNGIGLNFHSLEGINYPTGLLGVGAALVATPTAVRATATITETVIPTDGDGYFLANMSASRGITVLFKTTLTTTFDGYNSSKVEIAIGADLAASIANVASFFNGTGVEGTTYHWRDLTISASALLALLEMTVSATTGTTITYRAVPYGTGPNTWLGTENVDAGGTMTVTNFSGGTVGTGATPVEGTYKYRYSRTRTADGAISYASPEVTVTQTAPGQINLTTMVSTPTRDAIDYDRWYRTTNGGSLFYKGADVAIASLGSVADAVTDTTLTTESTRVKYDDRIYRPYTAGYPVKCKCAALYKGRVFAGGSQPASRKSAGTASVTLASYSVTLSAAAYPTVDWIGRTFRVAGSAREYLINDVAEATRVLTLNLIYEGATNATAGYEVLDGSTSYPKDPLTLYYSETGLPNNWPVTNSIKTITSQDPTGISALRESWDSLVVWTQTSVHRVIGESGSGFRSIPVGDGIGAFNNRCVVNADGALFWIGAKGAFRWGGSGDPENLSDPKNDGGIPRGIARTIARLNLNEREMFFGNYNPTEDVVRWWVAMDGETLNNYVIVYDLQTDQFTLDTCQAMTAAATIPDATGTYRTVAGDAFGNLWQLDTSTSDGVFGIDRVAVVSSYASTTNKITLTTTPLSTASSGYAGCPVLIVSSVDGSVQRAKIASNTSSVITLTGPLSAVPVSTDTVIVGGIHYRLRTGRWDLEQAFVQRGLPAVTVTFVPSTGQLWCAVAKDTDEPTVYAPGTVRGFSGCDVVDVSTTTGRKLFWHRKGKCSRLCVEFFGFTLGTDFALVGWLPTVVTADSVGG